MTSAPGEWGETTDQLRTTPAELSARQRSTMDTSDMWFTLDNRDCRILMSGDSLQDVQIDASVGHPGQGGVP